MNLVGNKMVIPLFDAELSNKDEYELCKGISLFTLGEDYLEKLHSTPELIARYKDSLPHMKIGLAIEPNQLPRKKELNFHEAQEFSVFISMTIRLITGVPVDIPFWFDVEEDEIKGWGNTRLQTFRTGGWYQYPLDDGKQSIGLLSLQEGLSDLVEKYFSDYNKNVLIRAIEFCSIGFQIRHIPTRLVNSTIFLESLFSISNTEIAFQIASSVSWYLKSDEDEIERVKLFKEIKELYGYRSKIVHGADISSKNKNMRNSLILSEELNTTIMQMILRRNHVNVFSMNQDKRYEELRALVLGVNCALLKHDRE